MTGLIIVWKMTLDFSCELTTHEGVCARDVA
jgi:hypothetical protein